VTTIIQRVAEVSGLTRAFEGRTVLDALDMAIGADEFVALLGRSGSGKSTLLRVMAGLDSDYTGEVWVPAQRSVVFQEARLIPWLRADRNVVLGLPPGADGRDGLRRRSLVALEEVGLAGRARSWPVTLSGGEAQRVALARALVREPRLLLLDEPFGALDALTRAKMHRLLEGICERHRPGVLLVTHDVDEAIGLADRILVLTDGRISLDMPVDDGRRSGRSFGQLRERLLHELGLRRQGTELVK
jgi:sulfonate transport system ATP-binding protein